MALRFVLLTLLLAAPGLRAQLFHFGARVGITPTDSIKALKSPNRDLLAIGPTAELRLPFGLGGQMDLLYRKRSAVSAAAPGASTWELPIQAKFTAPGLVLHPFVSGGYSYQWLGKVYAFQNESVRRRGFVAGAGLEVRAPLVRVSPEIRFTRWNKYTGASAPNASQFGPETQVQLLVGVTF